MLSPLIVGHLVDTLTSGTPTHGALIASALALLGIGTVRAIAVGAYSEASARLGLAVVTDARTAVFAHLRSTADRGLSAGDLISRTVRDPERLYGFIDRVFVRSVTTICRAVFPMVMLFVLNPVLTLWALAPIPIQQLGLRRLQRKLHRATRSAADANAALTEEVHKRLTSPTSANNDDALDDCAYSLETKELRSKRLVAALRAWVWICTSAGIALLWYHGSLMVNAGTLSIGTLVSFAGYAAFVYRPFRQFTQVVKSYQAGRASLERIAELIDKPAAKPAADQK